MTEVLEGQLKVHAMSLPLEAHSQEELIGVARAQGPTVASASVISLQERRFILGRERVLQRIYNSGLLHLKLS
jgi:hypothetical protein